MSGKKKSEARQLGREVKRTTQRSQRDVKREIQGLERQEKTLIQEIRNAARTGNKKLTSTYAKQLIQVRNSKERLSGVSMHLGSVGTQAQLMATNAAAMEAVGNTAAAVQQVNASLNPATTAAMMRNFEKEMTKMELNMEQLDEFLEDAFDGDDVEEEADDIVAETLAGIGIDLHAAMTDAPVGAPSIGAASVGQDAAPVAPGAAAEAEDAEASNYRVDDLEARLASLGAA